MGIDSFLDDLIIYVLPAGKCYTKKPNVPFS